MRTIAVLFSLAFLSCNICTKKVPCPPFQDAVLEDWFPLNGVKGLTFKASNNEVRKFTFDSIITSQPYTTDKTRGSGCNSSQEAISKERDAQGMPALSVVLRNWKPFYENGTERDVTVQLLGLNFIGTDPDSEGFRQVRNTSHGGYGMLTHHASVQLNGKTFYSVQSIYFDTISNLPKAPVYKVYISRLNGIIAYETYRPVLLWVKE